MLRRYMPAVQTILSKLRDFTSAQPGSLVLVNNATTGVNTVLNNIGLETGDQLITTGQEYFASRNALMHRAERAEAEVVEVPLEIPVEGPQQIVDSIMSRVTHRTVLVLLDHVSSPTGMVYPVKRLVSKLNSMDIDVLIDGAHGPGMLPLDLSELGAAYYTGNCHKWMCSPKTSAILYVRPDRQKDFHPMLISHLPRDFRTDLSDFQVELMWNGTLDPTPRMTLPFAMDHIESMHPEGWRGVMDSNRAKASKAMRIIQESTGLRPPCPPEMFGSMVSFCLPTGEPKRLPPPEDADPLQKWLLEEKGIEVPVTFTAKPPGRFLRVSAQLYNTLDQYRYLADALEEYPGL